MVSVLPQNVSKEPIELYQPLSDKIVKKALELVAKERNIDVVIELDSYKISSGGLFGGFLATSSPCIAIYHPNHRTDYYSMVIELKSSYGKNYAYIHRGGISKNYRDMNLGNDYYDVQNGDVVKHRAGFLGKMFANQAQQKIQDEELFYDAMYDLIGIGLGKADIMTNSNKYSTNTSNGNSQNRTSQQPRQRTTYANQPKSTYSNPKSSSTPRSSNYEAHRTSNNIVNGSYSFSSNKKKK